MPNRINILNELRELGSVLASLPPVPAFEVPRGYFEAFPAAMLELVTAGPVVLSPRLEQAKNTPYEAPQGYFEGLASRILALAKAGDAAAAEEIALLSPLLSRLDKRSPFSAPDGYFSELADDMMAGAVATGTACMEEEESLSPMLTYLRNEQVYEVPAGYFEQLPAQVMENIRCRQPGRVISMKFSKLVRYAAAAVVAGVIAVGGWIYFYKGTPDSPAVVASASAPAIPGNISEEALQLYLEGDIATPEVAIAPADINETDIKEMLADVSDEELQKYADKYSIKPGSTN